MPNPLVQALALGQVTQDEREGPERITLPIPRVIRVRVDEVQNGRTALPGTALSLKIDGTVKMIDEDGDIMVNVTRVDGRKSQDTPADPDRDVIQPAESPAPS